MLYDVPAREEFRNLIRTMTKDDLFIIVSFSGESPAVKELAQALKLRDIPFISITRLHDNTLASLSTVNFMSRQPGSRFMIRRMTTSLSSP